MPTLENRAKGFAEYHHGLIGQKRKYTGEPYINHPAAVVKIVESIPHTKEMIAAAWLHDTVEDTNATLEDVRDEFGIYVAELVEMLTDISKPSDGNRAYRKTIDRNHTASAYPDAKTIKLADLIDNTKSIVEHDSDFAKVYLAEKVLLLEVLKDGDPKLWEIAKNQIVTSETSEATSPRLEGTL